MDGSDRTIELNSVVQTVNHGGSIILQWLKFGCPKETIYFPPRLKIIEIETVSNWYLTAVATLKCLSKSTRSKKETLRMNI